MLRLRVRGMSSGSTPPTVGTSAESLSDLGIPTLGSVLVTQGCNYGRMTETLLPLREGGPGHGSQRRSRVPHVMDA